MSKRAWTVILAAVLAWLGVIAIITGIIRDDKSFFAIAGVCMGCTGIFLFLFSLRHTQWDCKTRIGRGKSSGNWRERQKRCLLMQGDAPTIHERSRIS